MDCVTIRAMPDSQDNRGAAVTPVPSVAEFVQKLRRVVESGIPLGWVTGEVSNLTRAASGHVYFSLKDARAQIRCTMWRNRAQLLPFQLREGMHVEVRAQATVYEARGDLQLSVENIRQAGQGNLYETYLRLKARLEEEGLFAPERKRPLPVLPRGIGVVTSLAAAALHDVLSTLHRRASGIPVVIYPAFVQGEGAGSQIAGMIRLACERMQEDGIEVLIVCRGGGSIEDLWAFNDEAVVRAVADCQMPVISGVGHETDFTLIDFVADMRGATPTASAELASAGWYAMGDRLSKMAASLSSSVLRHLRQDAQRVDGLQHRLEQSHPRMRVKNARTQLAHMEIRLRRAWLALRQEHAGRVATLEALLAAHAPNVSSLRIRLDDDGLRLSRGAIRLVQGRKQFLDSLSARLEGVNPQAVVARGYAIVRDSDGRILRTGDSLQKGEDLDIELASEHLHARLLGRSSVQDH